MRLVYTIIIKIYLVEMVIWNSIVEQEIYDVHH